MLEEAVHSFEPPLFLRSIRISKCKVVFFRKLRHVHSKLRAAKAGRQGTRKLGGVEDDYEINPRARAQSYRADRAIVSRVRVAGRSRSPRRLKIRRRRYRMAAALGRAGSDDDDSGTRALLRRNGAAQERALDADAELHPGRDRVDSMGAVRLQPRVRARQRFSRRTFVGGTPRCQRRTAVSRLFGDS